MMTTDQIEAALLDRYGVRTEAATREYVARRLASSPAPFPILAGDARTGLPVRQVVVPGEMVDADRGRGTDGRAATAATSDGS